MTTEFKFFLMPWGLPRLECAGKHRALNQKMLGKKRIMPLMQLHDCYIMY